MNSYILIVSPMINVFHFDHGQCISKFEHTLRNKKWYIHDIQDSKLIKLNVLDSCHELSSVDQGDIISLGTNNQYIESSSEL